MMDASQQLNADMLEQYVDSQGLAGVLDVLAATCREKAEHVQSNWQDARLAELWEKAADIIDRAAAKVPNLP